MTPYRTRSTPRHPLFATLLVGLALLVPLNAAAAPPPADEDPALENRLRALEEELRCLVCQNQTLADSPSEWADGMRDEIRAMLRKGMSDDEVVDFLVARYGDFVTYRPPLKPVTYLLWFGPVLLLILAIVVLVVLVARRSGRQTTTALSEEERQRAEDILGLKEKSS